MTFVGGVRPRPRPSRASFFRSAPFRFPNRDNERRKVIVTLLAVQRARAQAMPAGRRKSNALLRLLPRLLSFLVLRSFSRRAARLVVPRGVAVVTSCIAYELEEGRGRKEGRKEGRALANLFLPFLASRSPGPAALPMPGRGAAAPFLPSSFRR